MFEKSRAWTYASASNCQRPRPTSRKLASCPLLSESAPLKRNVRSSSNASPRACNSTSSVNGATSRTPPDQLSYFARTLAGTRCALGVVQNPCPRSQRPLTMAKPCPRRGANVAETSLSPRSSISALALSNPNSPAPALSSCIVPATAPAPNAPDPPPRVTLTDDNRSGASALNGM